METPTVQTFSPVQLVHCGNYGMCGNLAKPYQGRSKSYCNECRANHLLSRTREFVDQLEDEGLPFQARLDQAEKTILEARSALAQAKDAGAGLREAFAAFLGPIAELRELLDQAAQKKCGELLERAEAIYDSGVFTYMNRWAQVKLLCVLRTLRTLDPKRYSFLQGVTWLTYEEEEQVENGRPLRYDEIARVLPNLERNAEWARECAEQDSEQAFAQASAPVKTASRNSSRKREKSLRDQQLRLQMRGSSSGGKKR